MSSFHRLEGVLHGGGVPLVDLAARFGTPLYAYSADMIAARYREVDEAFSGYPHTLHYALKANSTLGIARLLRSLGAAADANSGGEIEVALRAGFTPGEIVFTGVGKSDAELARAIELGLRSINAESEGEIERIDAIASARGTRAKVAVRVNPDIDARSHPHISTGRKNNKFGVAIEDAREMCLRMRGRKGVQIVGLHSHVGSQITHLEPLQHAAEALAVLACELRRSGIQIEHLDIGGGLGIPYEGQTVPSASEYAAAVLPIVRKTGLALILEPGRFLVGEAGVLITRVVDIKPQAGGKLFVIVDAGMTELMRPMLYGAFHRIEPVLASAAPEALVDFVGPICETTDTLGKDRRVPEPAVGDLMVVFDAGAYGSVMASNYNRRPMPAEVLIQNGQAALLRRRQTIDDLVALEL
ncbi:MAG TPA: diaminopimelate decarboxylase [Vicinamibacterales bacterium]|nr:diaminopimelate decarboxylase [Vicinamibacterales bacterium]